MREEKLFRAIGEIDEELIEQAEKISIENEIRSGRNDKLVLYRKCWHWGKYVALAAIAVIVLMLVTRLETVPKNTEEVLLDFTIAFEGMGYEGIMGYEMPTRGNPW